MMDEPGSSQSPFTCLHSDIKGMFSCMSVGNKISRFVTAIEVRLRETLAGFWVTLLAINDSSRQVYDVRNTNVNTIRASHSVVVGINTPP